MKKIMMVLVAFLIVISAVGQVQAAESFKDVNGHWAKGDIQAMSKQGYIGGYADGTFKPNGKITRAEFISILTRILEVPVANNSFTDASAANWAKEAIGGAAQVGMIDKTEYATSFKPNQPITRREMAKMIALGLGYQNAEYKELLNTYKGLYHMDLPFADAKSISQSDIPYMALAFATGIMGGDTADKVNPKANATRAEATAMLHRLVKNKDSEPSSFLAVQELEAVAIKGTNAFIDTKLQLFVENFRTFKINTYKYVGQIKRLYFIPTDTNEKKSIFEKKFIYNRSEFIKYNKGVINDGKPAKGFYAIVMGITPKVNAKSTYSLYGSNLFTTNDIFFPYWDYKTPPNKFNFVSSDGVNSIIPKQGKEFEVVFIGYYSDNSYIDIQSNLENKYYQLFRYMK